MTTKLNLVTLAGKDEDSSSSTALAKAGSNDLDDVKTPSKRKVSNSSIASTNSKASEAAANKTNNVETKTPLGKRQSKRRENVGAESAKKMKLASTTAREEAKEEAKMSTRPRRDSSSSLAKAMDAKAAKDNIDDYTGSSNKTKESKADKDVETASNSSGSASHISPQNNSRRPVVRMDRDKETEVGIASVSVNVLELIESVGSNLFWFCRTKYES